MSYYKKVKKSNSHNAQRLSSIKGRTIIHTKEGGVFSHHTHHTHRTPLSSVVIVNPSSDASIRDLADEQQRAVASLTRRIDNIETNIDHQQFNVLQQQLAMSSLPPPSENLEDFEREYTQKLADMHAEIQELRIELLSRETPVIATKELTIEPQGLAITPDNSSLHDDLAALKVEWQLELKTNNDTLTELLKTNLQSQTQKYMQDLQQIQNQLSKHTTDSLTLQTLQKQLQDIKLQLATQTQDIAKANITLASKNTVEDVKLQVDELKKNTQAWIQSASDLSLSTKSLESKVDSLQVLHGKLSQLRSDMDMAVAQANKTLQGSISQWKTDMEQQLAQKIQSVETQLKEERSQQDQIRSGLIQHNAKLTEMESSVGNMKVDVNLRVAAVEDTTSKVQSRVAAVEDTASKVQSRVATLESLLEQVSSQLGEFSLSIPQILDKRLGTLAYLQDELQKHMADTSISDRLSVVEKEWKKDRDSILADLSQLHVSVSQFNHIPQVESSVSAVSSDLMVEFGNKLSRIQASHEQSIDSLRTELEGYCSKALDTVYRSLHADSLKQMEEKLSNAIQQIKDQVTEHNATQIESKIHETKQIIDANMESKVIQLETRMDMLKSTVRDSIELGIADVKNNLQQFKMEVIAKQSLVEYLRSQLDELSQTLRERQQSIDGELSRLKNEVVYKEQIEVADTVTDEFEDKLAHIKSEFHAELDSKMHKLQEDIQLLIEQKLSKFGGEGTSLEEKLNQEVMQYRQQIQSFSSYLQEMKIKNADELSSIKEQYNSTVQSTRNQVQTHIEDCQKEIQGVEARLVSILAELEIVHQENKTVSQSVQAHTEETRAAVTDLKEGHSSLFAQIPPIRKNILDIEKRISEIKHEFDTHEDVHDKKSIQYVQHLGTLDQKVDTLRHQVESMDQKTADTLAQTAKKTLDLSEACKYLDEEYKMISGTFKSQYEVLQKRYQELHTIIVSNMEETERGNQSVRELIEMHTRIEQEYKDMTHSYERQQQEYKTLLQKRDDRLKLLEDQVKSQLDNVDQRLTMLQNDDGSKVGSSAHSTRIDELAQPRYITPKKIV